MPSGAPFTPQQSGTGSPEVAAATHQHETLSGVDVGRAMIAGGFPRDVHVIATGIGLVKDQESGGKTDAVNPTTCDGRYHAKGIFQICGPHSGINGGRELPDNQAFNPVINARAAYRLWKADGRTFAKEWPNGDSHGAGHIEEARQAIKAGALGPGGFDPVGAVGDAAGAIGDAVTSVPDALNAIATVLEKVAQFFVGLGELLLTPEGWGRIGKLIFGAGLIIYGLNVLSKQLTGVDPVGTAKKAGVVAAAAL